MRETFIYGREIDFRKSNYFEIPVFWADTFLLMKIDSIGDDRSSIGKVWFLPFIHGFGFVRAQPTDMVEGLNLLQFSGVSDFYRIALQPYPRVTKCNVKIWTTDYEPRAVSQLNDIQNIVQYLL